MRIKCIPDLSLGPHPPVNPKGRVQTAFFRGEGAAKSHLSLEYPALSVLPPPPPPPSRTARSKLPVSARGGGGGCCTKSPASSGGGWQPSLAHVSDQVIWEAGVAPECQARSVGRERPPPRTLGGASFLVPPFPGHPRGGPGRPFFCEIEDFEQDTSRGSP